MYGRFLKIVNIRKLESSIECLHRINGFFSFYLASKFQGFLFRQRIDCERCEKAEKEIKRITFDKV